MTANVDCPAEAEFPELIRSFRSMIEGAFGEGAARRALDGHAFDRSAWSSLASDYGFFGLHVPAALGGQDASFVYSALASRAAGALVLPAPYSTTIGIAVPLLVECADEATIKTQLASILSGERIVAVAGFGAGLAGTSKELRLADDATVVGSASHVHFADEADAFLAVAVASSGDPQLVLIDRDCPAVEVQGHEVVDGTRPQSRVTFDRAPGVKLARTTPQSLATALAQATILLSSEAIGGARAALDMTLGYVKVRQQFGRPIGSFQALQHKLVDLFAEVDAAQATVDWAASLVDAEQGDPLVLVRAASFAKAAASDAYSRISREALHAHGGIGFTWEHDAHLYLKRALTDRALLGTPAQHRRLIADALDHDLPATPVPETDEGEE